MRIATTIAALATLVATPVLAQPPASFSARMKALTDLQRRGAVRGAIVNSGERCAKIAAVAHQGPYKNLDMWVARCNGATPKEPASTYGFFIGQDGDVQVRKCADLVALKLPACKAV